MLEQLNEICGDSTLVLLQHLQERPGDAYQKADPVLNQACDKVHVWSADLLEPPFIELVGGRPVEETILHGVHARRIRLRLDRQPQSSRLVE